MKPANIGDKVYFVNSFESDMVLDGEVKDILEAQVGNTCIISCNGGDYKVPESYILRKM
ncbi:hypothetical protein PM10SUCC1_32720 [Propionigenium maris DSM 9537]|uniref:Uncharacterized protein n=1 Tax=Propionigenium maris DSM 9537 TaxID=1123000 RepID=A0A9W6GME4_9FUSO|nr:hypothetical protein [Propionigenium maris]GLI57758.1 hypothetical protein PM10SUCC1_32720 [Propionigenium maris DSM 9537]